MSQTNQTPDEVLDSLTGHEETWIADQFSKSIGELAFNFVQRSDAGPYWRALIFILKRRDNVNEDDARNAVLAMTLRDVMAYWPSDDSGEAEESGKDESQSEPEPESSLSSAS